ncbi:MAG: LysR family transcriptional regulator, partial [Aurantimonas coralicida]|nr:LysR family transcriptional regulator [Aurantimonas coralicida]
MDRVPSDGRGLRLADKLAMLIFRKNGRSLQRTVAFLETMEAAVDRLQSLRMFVAVAEAESFAGGARTLGLSGPSATRGVNALEARLGARLFTRTTRKVRLTDVGRRYLAEVREILAQLQAADESAAGAAGKPVGQLRVTCPQDFGRIYI